MYFADDTKAILAPRDSPEPDDIDAKSLRQIISDATNEFATVEDVLPKLVALEAIIRDKVAFSVAKLLPILTIPKPDRTIGWRSEVFSRKFPKACRSLRSCVCPVIAAPGLAWLLLTIEAKGDSGSLRVARLQNLHN